MSRAALRRILWLVLGLAAGTALAALFIFAAPEPEREDRADAAEPVRVIEAQSTAVRPQARGFGVARPARTWEAVAEVEGTIIFRNPRLQDGNILTEGAKLLEIDPSDYELAVAEAEAEIATLQAERDQLDQEERNTERSLSIERERLDFAEQELSRIRTLAERGTVSSARLDEQESATLQQRQAVRTLENQLDLIPSRRARLKAGLERARAQLERAKRNLADTVVTAPMDLRVGEVTAELHNFVAAGQTLLSADGINAAEVPAQLPFEAVRRVVGSAVQPSPRNGGAFPQHPDLASIEALVTLVSDRGVRWQARVDRVESGLDPRTRSIQVVAVVDEPYRGASPPERPPLVKNMYTEVVILGQPSEPGIVIPDYAVHEDRVYVVDGDSRLAIRPVSVAFRQKGLAVVTDGLEAGDRVVLDDLVPAIEGTLLAPDHRRDIEDRLLRAAQGQDLP